MNPSLSAHTATPAPAGTRVAAVLIDMLPTFLVLPIIWIPIVGQFIGGFLLFVYWQFRDVFGRSLGKLAMGLKIQDGAGNLPSVGALILRNLPFGICFLLSMIPFIGYMFLAGAFIVDLIELILVVTNNNRIGDRMAGTVVVQG